MKLPNVGVKATAGIGEVLDHLAARTPLAQALRTDGVHWNFIDLKHHCDALARGLKELGLKKGASVTIGSDGPESVVATIAAEKLGLKLAAGKVRKE
jgi:non-ribosomal peptide synthetase component E (peptide arylation enzyme)